GAAGGGGAAAWAVVGDDARVPAAVGGVPIGGERGAAGLRVRLGVVAVRGDVPRGVDGLVGRVCRSRGAVAAAGAAVPVPGGAGRAADQAAWGPGVAGPDGAGLSTLDAAAAGPVLVARAPPAAVVAPGGGGGQPRDAAGGAVRAVRAAAGGERGGRCVGA